MKKNGKIMFAALAFALTFGGGIATTSLFATANETPVANNVLDALTLEQGMSIRTAAPDGLRFTATIGMSDSEYAESGITEIGTVLMPAANVDGELTIDEADGAIKALLIVTENWAEETNENAKTYHSVLVANDETSSFPAAFYNTPVSARAYAKFEDGSVKYSANTETRSIGYVANVEALVGELDEDGVIETIANGATKTVTVNDGEAMELGSQYQATFSVGGVATVSTEEFEVVWSVEESNAAIIVDENGLVVPVKAGEATLVATAVCGEKSFSAETTVTVNAATEVADYYAMKVNGATANTITDNDFVAEIQGNQVVSATIYGGDVYGYDLSDATVANGNVTIPASSFEGLVDREQTIKVVTDVETKYFYQDVVTYAIKEAGDLCAVDAGSGFEDACAEWVQACGVTSGSRQTESWGEDALIILANDVDCSTFVAWSGAVAGRVRTGAPLDYDPRFGETGVRFEGVFDGRGYTISNIELYARSNAHGDAFFGSLGENGTVKNLKIVNAKICDGGQSQGFFGRTSKGIIENVYIDVTPNGLTNGYAIGRFNDTVRVIGCTFIVRTNAAVATTDEWKIIDYASVDPCRGTNWTNTVIYSDYRVRSSDCNLNEIIKPLSELPTA